MQLVSSTPAAAAASTPAASTPASTPVVRKAKKVQLGWVADAGERLSWVVESLMAGETIDDFCKRVKDNPAFYGDAVAIRSASIASIKASLYQALSATTGTVYSELYIGLTGEQSCRSVAEAIVADIKGVQPDTISWAGPKGAKITKVDKSSAVDMMARFRGMALKPVDFGSPLDESEDV